MSSDSDLSSLLLAGVGLQVITKLCGVRITFVEELSVKGEDLSRAT